MTGLLLAAGVAALILGAELLVRGASRLARALGLSPLIIGLTVVAFGTSMPELAVSVRSGLAGQADIALGNVVGSNIFNVLFILGLSALVAPLAVSERLVRLDVPILIGVSVLVPVLGWNGSIGRLEGAALVAGIVIYTVLLIRKGGGTGEDMLDAGGPGVRSRAADLLLVAGGLALLVIGSGWFVNGAVSLARTIGLSELTIGLTIVAAGTSLPEAATSIVASARGARDIAVGNVVGSNIFNVLGVLGASALLAPHGIAVPPEALRFDIPIMVGAAVACLAVFFTGNVIARWEGGVFFGYYVVYTMILVLGAQHPTGPAPWRTAVLGFLVPLTALTLAVGAFREGRRRRSTGP